MSDWVLKAWYQISAKQGPDLRFVVKVNTKSQWPKSSLSQIVKFMDRGWVTRPWVEYRVKYQVEYWILGEFLSKKVKFYSIQVIKVCIYGS